ncbi:MAG: PKD domain-containing protein [Bacteroidia bacterium]|nr:PKD domain-containing protein [Bacteroidia bacterium]
MKKMMLTGWLLLLGVLGLQAQQPSCVAGFTYVDLGQNTFFFLPDSALFGANVDFTWVYGDGTSDVGPFPTHTFPAAPVGASYQVCLIIQNNTFGCTDSSCTLIQTNAFPVCYASFSYSTSPVNPLEVSFINQSQGSVPGTPLTYTWDFGDGTTSTVANPVHTYPVAGLYTVTLTIADQAGCVNTIVQHVNLQSTVCAANVLVQLVGPNTVTLSAQPALPQGTYFWDFGDSTSGFGPVVTHTYPGPGIYVLCLTAIDSASGCQSTSCVNVQIGQVQNCTADFSFVVDSATNTVTFTNLSTASAGAQYLWHLGDGNISTDPNPVYTYATPGFYHVTLYVFDSLGCSAQSDQLVIVGGGSTFCDATFQTFDMGGNFFAFNPNFINPTLNYVWDYGDGTNQYGFQGFHYYPVAGTYIICLTVTDSLNACNQTWCDTLVVTGGGACSAAFGWQYDPVANAVTFTNISQASAGASYFWSFGDSTFSTDPNPVHTYASQGAYTVCLTVTDSACTNTFCDYIYTATPFLIAGRVNTGSTPAAFAQVYLIQHDSISGTLSVVDSTVTDPTGVYVFYSGTPGTYLVKAALLPISPDYANYMPTYLGDVMFWYQAQSIVYTQVQVLNPDLNLLAGNNPGGPGFIGGLVSQGANKNEGDPMGNVSVLVTYMNGAGVAYTVSHTDGTFKVENLAYGTYKVYVEMPGRMGDPHIVTLTPAQPGFEDANFEINTFAVIATGLETFTAGEVLGLYPNPAADQIELSLEMQEAADLTLSVRNLMGQTLSVTERAASLGSQTIRLDVNALPQGIYVLDLEANGQRVSFRFVKQ